MYLRSQRKDHERTLMGVIGEDDIRGDGGIGGGDGGGGGRVVFMVVVLLTMY